MHNPKTLNYEFQRLYLLPRKAVINKSFKSTFVSVFFLILRILANQKCQRSFPRLVLAILSWIQEVKMSDWMMNWSDRALRHNVKGTFNIHLPISYQLI